MTAPTNNVAMLTVATNLLQIAKDNYKLYALDLKNRQTTLQNIYFWIASSLFTLYAAAFRGLLTGQPYTHFSLLEITPACMPQVFLITAFGCCGWVILTGVDAMRGRGSGERLILDRITPAGMLDYYMSLPGDDAIKAMRHLMEEIEKNAHNNALRCQRVGIHLRHTSWALIVAICCGLAILIF